MQRYTQSMLISVHGTSIKQGHWVEGPDRFGVRDLLLGYFYSRTDLAGKITKKAIWRSVFLTL